MAGAEGEHLLQCKESRRTVGAPTKRAAMKMTSKKTVFRALCSGGETPPEKYNGLHIPEYSLRDEGARDNLLEYEAVSSFCLMCHGAEMC